MADPFANDHDRVFLPREDLHVRDLAFYEYILPLFDAPLVPLNLGVLRKVEYAEDIERIYRDIVKETLVHNRVRYLSPLEYRLAQVVVLHKLQRMIQTLPTWKKRQRLNVKAVVGTIIQQHLTNVFPVLTPTQSREIFHWGIKFHHPYDRKQWYDTLVGGMSAARVIRATVLLDDVRVYMPSSTEDINYGIDLFVLSGKMRAAISVKTGKLGTGFCVSLANRTPPRNFSVHEVKNLEQIANGAHCVSVQYGRIFHPIYISVECPQHSKEVIHRDEDTIALYTAIKEAYEGEPFEETIEQTILREGIAS